MSPMKPRQPDQVKSAAATPTRCLANSYRTRWLCGSIKTDGAHYAWIRGRSALASPAQFANAPPQPIVPVSSMNPRVLFASFAVAALAIASAARAAEDGFTSIFNGKSLEGWEGNPAIWSVQDGAITGQTKPDTNLKHNTFLVWKAGTVEDFELRFRYKIVGGNSGLQYRSKVAEQGPQGPIVAGYQADFEAGKNYSGILYEERGRGILAQRGQKTRITAAEGGKFKIEVVETLGKSEELQAGIKNEDWNDYVVVAQGNHLVHSINGKVTADVTDEDAAHAAKSGVLAFQVHAGPPMVVQFKDVRLKKLPAGTAAVGTDLDRMQGEWVAVSGLREGQALPQEWISSIRLKIQGSKYEVAWNDGGDQGTLKLKSDAQPKHMDITSDASGAIAGIYALQDRFLQVCYGTGGAERPKDFDAPTGSSSLAISYKRK